MAYSLYKIFYGETLAYIGRTTQKIDQRIHGHLFKKPGMRTIAWTQITRVEVTSLATVADMYLYEIYYINKLKPVLNCDDKSRDDLTIVLPELEWGDYPLALLSKWKDELYVKDMNHAARQEARDNLEEDRRMRRHTMGYDEYTNWLEHTYEPEMKRLSGKENQ